MENKLPSESLADKKVFGSLPDGRNVIAHTISNGQLEMTVINFGAIITSLKFNGLDVVLGFDTIEDYLNSKWLPAPPYFGAVAGRYAGRISNSRFSIDDVEYRLNPNNNGHTLHGGIEGFDRALWDVKEVSGNSVTLQYTSADGEERFPGVLSVEVTYSVTSDNEVLINYQGTCTKDTVINLTQHSYFNLEGHQADLKEHELLINSNQILEIDHENIPSGKIMDAAAKDMDFSEGGKSPFFGIDDSFVIDNPKKPAAVLLSKKTGMTLTVTSDQPALHIYVGGNLFGRMKGKAGGDYHTLSGICFESQNFPDAPNRPEFPTAILRKGEKYSQKTIWKFNQTDEKR